MVRLQQDQRDWDTKMPAHRMVIIAASLIVLFGVGEARSRVWSVNSDGSGDAPTIQAAIDSAVKGDQVAVAAGSYTWATQGGSDLYGGSMLVMKSGVSVSSTAGAEATVLDAQRQGRVVLFFATDSSAVIEGFTLRGGQPDGNACVPHCFHGSGGGILCYSSAGGIIRHNLIIDNMAQYGGGGIAINHASPLVMRNVIAGNTTPFRGGGIEIAGAVTQPVIWGNTIVGNEGGGITCVAGPTAEVRENIIAWNLLDGMPGRGLFCWESSLRVECNDIWANAIDALGPCLVDAGGAVASDPEFCAVSPISSQSFVLQIDSPCLAANNTCNRRIGAFGVGCGSVSIRGPGWGQVKQLYGRSN